MGKYHLRFCVYLTTVSLTINKLKNRTNAYMQLVVVTESATKKSEKLVL